MSYGYNNAILHVDLDVEKTRIEQPGPTFFRKYLGGGCVGLHYLLSESPAGVDALGPDNVLVFAPSVVTGAPVGGVSRYAVVAKSPLTGGVGASEAGGYWGAELKFAGIDAVVIRGRARKPVYLWIHDGDAELRDASALWGLATGECQKAIREELGDGKVRVAQIGPAGERLVRYACIVNELRHFNGRTGMGAVMGSKNLKAVAVRGGGSLNMADKERVVELSRTMAKQLRSHGAWCGMYEMGTSGSIVPQNMSGQLPTRNFTSGVFAGAGSISGEAIHQSMFKGREGCYACPVKCKRIISVDQSHDVDPCYGGPEYESLAALGSYTCVSDLHAVCKANEMCARDGLDTISAGAVAAFAMECYEKGILTSGDTGGMSLDFGNGSAMLRLIEMISRREGIGDILAEGTERAAQRFGKGAERLAMHCKGLEIPAQEARLKQSMALEYALAPIGADHMSSIQEVLFSPSTDKRTIENMRALGLENLMDLAVLDEEKVRFFYYAQQAYSVLDCLTLCMFCFPPIGFFSFSDVVQLVEGVTGWRTSLWELMKVGEREINMARVFNLREGVAASKDGLPDRLFEPLRGGPTDGLRVNREDFQQAVRMFYEMSNWHPDTGAPRDGKLVELGLGWLRDHHAK